MHAFYWFGDDVSWRLTQSLMHFLWQGCLIGLTVLVVDHMMRRAASSIRYSLHLVGFLAMAACLPATYALLGTTRHEGEPGSAIMDTVLTSQTGGESSLDGSTGDHSLQVV